MVRQAVMTQWFQVRLRSIYKIGISERPIVKKQRNASQIETTVQQRIFCQCRHVQEILEKEAGYRVQN